MIKYKGKIYKAVDEPEIAIVGRKWAQQVLAKFTTHFTDIRKKIIADEDGVYIEVLNMTSLTGDFSSAAEIESSIKRLLGQTWLLKDFKVKSSQERQQGFTANVKFILELTLEAEKFLKRGRK